MDRVRNREDLTLALDRLCSTDPRLAVVRARVERVALVPIRSQTPGFAGMVEIVITQQISRASAAAIHERLVRHIRPLTPETILSADERTMRSVGLSRPKVRALQALSSFVRDGQLDLDGVCDLPRDEATAAICRVPGLGPWTAGVYLMFSGGHPDIFPTNDVALQWSATWAFGHAERVPMRVLDEMARGWSPDRSTAARLLWANYALVKGRPVLP